MENLLVGKNDDTTNVTEIARDYVLGPSAPDILEGVLIDWLNLSETEH